MADIREVLQEANGASRDIDELIAEQLGLGGMAHVHPYSTDYTGTIEFIENEGYDWIMANVNGQVGGTPYACVGVPEDKASHGYTPLLSLWLSYFRAKLGDEREKGTTV